MIGQHDSAPSTNVNPLTKYAAITGILTAIDFTFYAGVHWACGASPHVQVLPRWIFDAECFALMSINALVPLSLCTLIAATIWSGRFSPFHCRVHWPRSLTCAWWMLTYNAVVAVVFIQSR